MVPRDWSDGSPTRNGKLVVGGGGRREGGTEKEKTTALFFPTLYVF